MTHQINDAGQNLIPEGEHSGVEYAADVLDYTPEVFDENDKEQTLHYEHRFVGVPASSEEEARKMLGIFNTTIRDDTGYTPILYSRTVTYGEWTRVAG